MSLPRTKETVKLRGIVSSGIQQSALFTEVPWVKRQFAEKLEIIPYPGTFNVNIVAGDQNKLDRVKKARGITIEPEDPVFCAATGFHVLVGKKVKGAAIFPLVPGYPPSQLEVISAERIKDALRLKDGDPVDIEVYL